MRRLLPVPVLLLLGLALAGCSASPAEPDAAMMTTAPSSPAIERSREDALPRTGPPRLGYVDGHVLVLPDGSEVPLPRRWGTTAIVEYAGGYLVCDDRIFEGTIGMQRLDRDGTVLESWSGTGPPVVSRDGRVAWVSLVPPESGLTGPTLLHTDSLSGGDERTQELEPGRLPFVTGWFRGDVVFRTWGRDASFVTDLLAPPRPVPPALEPGVPDPGGRIWARVVDGSVELRQADGRVIDVIRHLGLGRGFDTPPAWEDERFLLTPLVRGRRTALARVDTIKREVSLATGFRWDVTSVPALLPAR